MLHLTIRLLVTRRNRRHILTATLKVRSVRAVADNKSPDTDPKGSPSNLRCRRRKCDRPGPLRNVASLRARQQLRFQNRALPNWVQLRKRPICQVLTRFGSATVVLKPELLNGAYCTVVKNYTGADSADTLPTCSSTQPVLLHIPAPNPHRPAALSCTSRKTHALRQ